VNQLLQIVALLFACAGKRAVVGVGLLRRALVRRPPARVGGSSCQLCDESLTEIFALLAAYGGRSYKRGSRRFSLLSLRTVAVTAVRLPGARPVPRVAALSSARGGRAKSSTIGE